MPSRKLFKCILFLLMISSSFAEALSVKQVNLNQVITISTRIFSGTVLSKERAYDNDSGLEVNYFTFQVHEWILGGTSAQITIKQIATNNSSMNLVPNYKVGTRYLLFLPDDSSKGLVAPVGVFQGCLELKEVDHEWVIANIAAHSRLFTDTNDSELETLTRSGTNLENVESYSSLKNLIEKRIR